MNKPWCLHTVECWSAGRVRAVDTDYTVSHRNAEPKSIGPEGHVLHGHTHVTFCKV